LLILTFSLSCHAFDRFRTFWSNPYLTSCLILTFKRRCIALTTVRRAFAHNFGMHACYFRYRDSEPVAIAEGLKFFSFMS
jgi:hypothetical protein